jgi:hypothetical protein
VIKERHAASTKGAHRALSMDAHLAKSYVGGSLPAVTKRTCYCWMMEEEVILTKFSYILQNSYAYKILGVKKIQCKI